MGRKCKAPGTENAAGRFQMDYITDPEGKTRGRKNDRQRRFNDRD